MGASNTETSDLIQLLVEIKCKAQETIPVVDDMIRNFTVPLGDKYLSFLNMKYHLLLQYLIDISFFMARKVSGKKIETHAVIDRLIETRVVVDKTKTIDQKMKYLVNKILKGPDVGPGDIALSYRPNPNELERKDEKDAAEIDDSKQPDRPNIYVPPRITAVPYEDDTTESRKRKIVERSKKRALNSSLLKELRDEYSERPEEVSEAYRSLKLSKIKLKEEDKQEYEEDNLIRLPTTKQERQLMRLKASGLSDLTRFDSKRLKALGIDDGDDDNEEELRSHKNKKRTQRFKGKMKGSFRSSKNKQKRK